MTIMHNNKRKIQGYTLIEVLIAFLVLSIGLLGLAGLQATSLRYGQDAYMRSLTTIYANEIIDKMRMNTLNTTTTQKNTTIDSYVGAAAGACDATVNSIDNDVNCWLEKLGDNLPNGTGAIVNQGGSVARVDISWTEREDQSTKTLNWTVNL